MAEAQATGFSTNNTHLGLHVLTFSRVGLGCSDISFPVA